MTDARASGVYCERLGTGPDLVLVHGWGMHGGIWQGIVPTLAAAFRVTVVDLPGHGRSAPPAAFSLDSAAEALLKIAPQEAVWIGWSLGAMIGVQAALRAPARIRALALVAFTPRFVNDDGWTHGMDGAAFATFANDVRADYRKTLQRFLALQVRGTDAEKPLLKHMRELCLQQPPPHPRGLDEGLEILRHADLRNRLEHLHCPVLLLMGERDTLVPKSAGREVQSRVPHAVLREFPRVGHAPFLSAPDAFANELKSFVEGLS